VAFRYEPRLYCTPRRNRARWCYTSARRSWLAFSPASVQERAKLRLQIGMATNSDECVEQFPWNQTHFSHVLTSNSPGRQCARPAEDSYETHESQTLLFTILILTGFISRSPRCPPTPTNGRKTYTLTASRSPRRHFRRQHPRLHLGSERDRSQSHHQGGWAGHKLQDWERRSRGRASKMAIRWNSTCAFRVAPSSSWDNAASISTSKCRVKAAWTCTPATARSISPTLRAKCQLRSGDGSQEIDNVDGKLRATTGDGHIRANRPL